MTTRTELLTLIRTHTQDAKPYVNATWPDAPVVLARDDLLSSMVDRYNYDLSKYAPREIVEDIAGADTSLYRLGPTFSLVKYDDKLSAIQKIIYDYDGTDEDPAALDTDRYKVEPRLWSGTTADTLVFTGGTAPATGETARVTYTALHDLAVALPAITISERDVEPFAFYVAGRYLEVVAAEFLQHIDGTITGDLVTQNNVSIDQIKTLAGNFMSEFYKHFGVDPETQTKARSAWVSWDYSKNAPYTWYHR
jgi:hypothetical protein